MYYSILYLFTIVKFKKKMIKGKLTNLEDRKIRPNNGHCSH